ncbi:MAG: hypothetical protein C4532_02650 [Candidatus Abyssobacteria bacterium SURF_17]|uniref:V-type ATP synthase subunit C n=1 Tax=Candidatus Abyssobacteria bacterium SURF_17 TaxID=2093361 RepID=A0A419F7V3_9BACT|nr:MAG: hypothetical protein C4532_02650 [Candidatus Abyssubacteria bacterium SURF_17]
MDDLRYSYAVARINALSTKLLDRAFASRMLDAAEPSDILPMLRETAYAESLTAVDNVSQLEGGLIRELQKTHDLLGAICPDKELIGLFRKRYDFHNLKAMLKSKITGVPHADAIVDLGTYSIGELSSAVRGEAYRFVPRYISETALEALAEYRKAQALYVISYTCDRSMWRYLMQNALKHRNKIVITLFRDYINMANIKAFVRVKEFSKTPAEAFRHYFIPGGDYELDFFLPLMDEDTSLFLSRLRDGECERHIIAHGFGSWEEDESFWRLEVARDNFVLYSFHQMRGQLFSIAPLIYYLLRKEAEAKLIRTVVRCKLSGMRRAETEERLRYLYV